MPKQNKKKPQYVYTVHTRTHGTFEVKCECAPEIFTDIGTKFRILEFPEIAWFRLADVVCFFRRDA